MDITKLVWQKMYEVYNKPEPCNTRSNAALITFWNFICFLEKILLRSLGLLRLAEGEHRVLANKLQDSAIFRLTIVPCYFAHKFICCQTPVQAQQLSPSRTRIWLCFPPVTRTRTTRRRTPTPKSTRRMLTASWNLAHRFESWKDFRLNCHLRAPTKNVGSKNICV